MPNNLVTNAETGEVDLSPVAMQIIIAAGDGRKLAFEAVDAASNGNFEKSRELLAAAQKKVQEAHRIHTDQIQAEAAGRQTVYSLLFAHAQDTLMTVNTEYRILKKVLGVLESFEGRLSKLEKEIAK
jgi:PTS system cellobiose-specific IIA component